MSIYFYRLRRNRTNDATRYESHVLSVVTAVAFVFMAISNVLILNRVSYFERVNEHVTFLTPKSEFFRM